MNMTINIYEATYRTEQGKELYTKTWYAPTWADAYRMAQIYMSNVSHEAFDFILKLT
jgi:hypothetical protein